MAECGRNQRSNTPRQENVARENAPERPSDDGNMLLASDIVAAASALTDLRAGQNEEQNETRAGVSSNRARARSQSQITSGTDTATTSVLDDTLHYASASGGPQQVPNIAGMTPQYQMPAIAQGLVPFQHVAMPGGGFFPLSASPGLPPYFVPQMAPTASTDFESSSRRRSRSRSRSPRGRRGRSRSRSRSPGQPVPVQKPKMSKAWNQDQIDFNAKMHEKLEFLKKNVGHNRAALKTLDGMVKDIFDRNNDIEMADASTYSQWKQMSSIKEMGQRFGLSGSASDACVGLALVQNQLQTMFSGNAAGRRAYSPQANVPRNRMPYQAYAAVSPPAFAAAPIAMPPQPPTQMYVPSFQQPQQAYSNSLPFQYQPAVAQPFPSARSFGPTELRGPGGGQGQAQPVGPCYFCWGEGHFAKRCPVRQKAGGPGGIGFKRE